MIETAKKIRKIFNWGFQAPCESFEAFKEKEINDILDLIQLKNFDTPEKAVNTCYKMYSKKLAYQEIEEKKQIADEYDLELKKEKKIN
jgi:hypothetical protein